MLYLLLIAVTGYYLYENRSIEIETSGQAIDSFDEPLQRIPLLLNDQVVLKLQDFVDMSEFTFPFFIPIKEVEEIVNGTIDWEYREEDKLYSFTIGKRKFEYITGTDIGIENNRFFPMRGGVINYTMDDADSISISADFLHYGLGYHVIPVNKNIGEDRLVYVLGTKNREEIESSSHDYESINDWSFGQRYQQMRNLINPIIGSYVSTRESQWPGAPRSYRNGFHEGLDFYTHTSGIIIDKNTPIVSMDDGIVIRADLNYEELSFDYRSEILSIATQRSITPEYILDMLRGKSVWIEHSNGVVARYVHLDSIDSNVVVGEAVTKGQVIGTAGNSGTSYGVAGTDEGIHLHLDILLNGQLFWEGMTAEEAIDLLRKLFNE